MPLPQRNAALTTYCAMASNPSPQPQPHPHPRSSVWEEDDEDRISALPDDILLHIAGGLGLRAVVRASALSRRWKNIPRLLTDLTIDVQDFVPPDYSVQDDDDDDDDDQNQMRLTTMMQSYAAAARWLLSPTPSAAQERALKSVRLRFLLSEPYLLHPIGSAVEDMLEENKQIIDTLELDLCTTNHQQKHKATSRRYFASFLDAYPVAFGCLTSLTLQSLCFVGCSDFPRLLSSCTRLKLLSLSHCDFGSVVVEVVHAQQLVALEIRFCCFLRVELVQAPKLRRFHCDTWYGDDDDDGTPVRFLGHGGVPLLRSLTLACNAHPWRTRPFAFSKCISSSSGLGNLSTLHLDFRDGKIWIQPEHPAQLSFSNLRDVYLCNIFELCDLNWTLFVLESAPSLKNMYITLSRHVCKRNKFVANVVVDNLKWESSDFEHHNLQLLEIVGYAMEFNLHKYIRIVREHAVCLKRIHLLEQDLCSDCVYKPSGRPRLRSLHKYPSTEREKNLTRNWLTEGFSSPIKIVIG